MTELVDLVDGFGQIVKRAVPRDDAKRYDGLRMQVVIVVVIAPDGRVLCHRRADTTTVDPGRIDHVCGAVLSGESPLEAAAREAREELGVVLDDPWICDQGVNSYGRFRHLVAARAAGPPDTTLIDPSKVSAVFAADGEALESKATSGELEFTKDFFDELQYVLAAWGMREVFEFIGEPIEGERQ